MQSNKIKVMENLVDFVKSEALNSKFFDTDSPTSDNHNKAIITEKGEKTETQSMTLLVGNIDVKLLVDSRNACSILSKSIAIDVA